MLFDEETNGVCSEPDFEACSRQLGHQPNQKGSANTEHLAAPVARVFGALTLGRGFEGQNSCAELSNKLEAPHERWHERREDVLHTQIKSRY